MSNAHIETDVSAIEAALPSFVKKREGVESDDPMLAFDFWSLNPTGDDNADFQRGMEAFREAMQFAASFSASNFLSYVLGTIKSRHVLGALEAGFLDGLARKAAVSPPIELDAVAMASPHLRFGTEAANAYLATRDPNAIRCEISLLLGEEGPGVGPALHTFCRAAFSGGKH